MTDQPFNPEPISGDARQAAMRAAMKRIDRVNGHEKEEVKYVRAFMGSDAYLKWGSDSPHADGTWPDSRTILSEAFGDLPAEDAARLVG